MKHTEHAYNSRSGHANEPPAGSRRRKFDLVNFTKMHGLGNDFMVIESLTQKVNISSELIQQWADRHTGIGFDQLLLLGPPEDPKTDFQYTIFNSDGSEAGQCGNGARAIARFIVDQKLSLSAESTIATKTNTMKVRILESGLAQVDMDRPLFEFDKVPFKPSGHNYTGLGSSQLKAQTLNINNTLVEFYPLSVGNPHAVIFVDDVEKIQPAIATELQAHQSFPEGVNVGFAQVISDSSIKLRVFERGAGETQACGSGATAAAIAAIEAQKVSGPEIEVFLKGGQLSVYWDHHKLQMTGPAVRVFTGRLLVRYQLNHE